MNFLRLLPVFISFLLMGAHFLRAGQMVIAVALLCWLLLLLVRQFWVPWVIQLALLLGAAEWLLTLYSVAQVRIGQDMPWMHGHYPGSGGLVHSAFMPGIQNQSIAGKIYGCKR